MRDWLYGTIIGLFMWWRLRSERTRRLAFAIPAAILLLVLAFGPPIGEVATMPGEGPPQKAFWVQLILFVVSIIISYALAPKPVAPRPAALEDFNAPTAEEVRPIPVIFGTVWIRGPNCLWYGDLRSTPIKVKGGK